MKSNKRIVTFLHIAVTARTCAAFSKLELNKRRNGPIPADANLDFCWRDGVGSRSRIARGALFLSPGEDDFGGQGDGSYSDGEALAREFYNHVKNRDSPTALAADENEEYRRLYGEGADKKDGNENSETYDFLSESEARRRNREPFSRRREVTQGKYDIPAPLSGDRQSNMPGRKFTGRSDDMPRLDSTGTPSAGLFSGDGGYVYSTPAERIRGGGVGSSSPRARMLQQEFNLLGRATSEQTLIFQAVVVLFFLSFSVYIGLSGGITDGTERFGLEPSEFNALGEIFDFGGTPAESEAFEATVQAAASAGGSVWL